MEFLRTVKVFRGTQLHTRQKFHNGNLGFTFSSCQSIVGESHIPIFIPAHRSICTPKAIPWGHASSCCDAVHITTKYTSIAAEVCVPGAVSQTDVASWGLQLVGKGIFWVWEHFSLKSSYLK